MLAETYMAADDELDEASCAALVAPVTARTVHKVPVIKAQPGTNTQI